MSLLTVCQSVVKQTGLGTSPATVISNTDPTAVQLNALAEHGAKLLAKKNWERMVREQTLTMATAQETYSLPADWARYISDTAWDTTNYWPMRGSINPAEWQALKRGIVASSIRKRFRVMSNLVAIYPAPTTADVLILEYIRNTPWIDSGGTTYRATATADTDTTVFPEYLLELDLKWRWQQAKGADYSETKAEAEREIALALAQDTPAYALNMSTTQQPRFGANLPPNIPIP